MPEGIIHVAGVLDRTEAEMLIECGVEHLGIPLVLEFHGEDLSVDRAVSIVGALADRARFFLITYLDEASSIAKLCRRLGVDTVQLHGDISTGEVGSLRERWPDLRIIKSLIVRDGNREALVEQIRAFAPLVDAFITDTFDPKTGARGATGMAHDWQVSRALVEVSPKPVILAGGLNPDNVRRAISFVRPAGVDVHTGIEGVDGRKERRLTEGFISEARAGFAALASEFRA